MKNKKQFLQISVIAFVLSLVGQILWAIIHFERQFPQPLLIYYAILNVLSNLVHFTITPTLIFTVFYFIGKKPNLTFELRPILLALTIGNIASLFIGSILHQAIESIMDIESSLSAFYFLGIFLGLIAYLLPIFLLAALAGLSIGYIRQKKLTLTAKPELS